VLITVMRCSKASTLAFCVHTCHSAIVTPAMLQMLPMRFTRLILVIRRRRSNSLYGLDRWLDGKSARLRGILHKSSMWCNDLRVNEVLPHGAARSDGDW